MPQTNLHKTRGIILKQIKYSESSIIAKIYTENFGIQAYLVRGLRKKGSKTKSALFQSLSLVEMVVYHKEKSNIQNLKEIKSAYPFTSIPFEINKSAIAIFITEILYKSLKEEEANPHLFNYIFDSIKFLDSKQDKFSDFHILFIILLSKYLGFFPKQNYSETNNIFDLSEGIFVDIIPGHFHYLEKPVSNSLTAFLNIGFEDLDQHQLSASIRKQLLEGILEYYKLHIEGFGGLKSYPVLQTVLNTR